jgi:hypothetical protein
MTGDDMAHTRGCRAYEIQDSERTGAGTPSQKEEEEQEGRTGALVCCQRRGADITTPEPELALDCETNRDQQ